MRTILNNAYQNLLLHKTICLLMKLLEKKSLKVNSIYGVVMHQRLSLC